MNNINTSINTNTHTNASEGRTGRQRSTGVGGADGKDRGHESAVDDSLRKTGQGGTGQSGEGEEKLMCVCVYIYIYI